MTEEEKEAQEVPPRHSRFYAGGALLIALTAFIITLFTGGIAYGVQRLATGTDVNPVRGFLVEGVREFSISAQQWYYNPGTIKVNPGGTVRFITTSRDITHGFAINELGVNLALLAGEEMVYEIVIPPDMPDGVYTMYCSVFCGIGHPYMKGKLIVGNPTLLFGIGIGKILPHIATSVMAGLFAIFIIIGRRRAG